MKISLIPMILLSVGLNAFAQIFLKKFAESLPQSDLLVWHIRF